MCGCIIVIGDVQVPRDADAQVESDVMAEQVAQDEVVVAEDGEVVAQDGEVVAEVQEVQGAVPEKQVDGNVKEVCIVCRDAL